ncbi:MAG: hypothetical protein WCO00_09385 [Rhodospirillaceae bacterium]
MDKSDKVLAAIELLARNLTGQIAAVNAKVDAVAADVAVLKIGQQAILEHLDVAELKGRVEEQSRTIASLIPTRVAAVPGGHG